MVPLNGPTIKKMIRVTTTVISIMTMVTSGLALSPPGVGARGEVGVHVGVGRRRGELLVIGTCRAALIEMGSVVGLG